MAAQRQAYCTELSVGELKPALYGTDKARVAQNRDALMKFFMSAEAPLTHEQVVAQNRAMTAKASQ